MNKREEKFVCCICNVGFGIPEFPKLLPCMHMICRDCLFQVIIAQTSRQEYVDKESEIYCGMCQRYVHIPYCNLDDLPTVFKLIQNKAEQTICCEEGCCTKGFSYCYECNVIYCESHLEQHIKTNPTHKFEVFNEGKYCLKHHSIKTYYCCTCNEILCPECYVLDHSGDVVCKYLNYLSKFYTHDRFNISKRVYNLSQTVRRATEIYDSFYFNQQPMTDAQLAISSTQIEQLISQKINELKKGGKLLTGVSKMVNELANEFRIQSPICPSFSTIKTTTNLIPLKGTIDVDLYFYDVYEKLTLTSDIALTLVPISHILPGCTDYLEEINHDLADEISGDGGEASASIKEVGKGRIRITIKGESIGDVCLRVYVHKVEIRTSPLIFHVIEVPKKVCCSNKDRNVCCISSMCTLQSGAYVISDRNNHNIKIFDGNNIAVAGGFGKNNGQFKLPTGVTSCVVDGKEIIAVTDMLNCNVQLFNTVGNHIKTLGRSGPLLNGCLLKPTAVAISNNKQTVYVADSKYNIIQGFPINGQPKIIVQKKNIGEFQIADLDIIETESKTVLVILDSLNHRLVLFNVDDETYKVKGRYDDCDRRGHFSFPRSLAIDHTKNYIYVLDGQNRIQQFNYELFFMGMYEYPSEPINKIYYSSSLNKMLLCYGTDYLHEISLDTITFYMN
ncbi:nhl repeat-containing protein, putative [Entamoeba dispar SAW760]|uniref:Nhl repeat-containing protein, putative n=1 Tax=Entamoeba dispar (strain ATCC PRA-260 / SAW760) TaxID=370354 RepID=B0EB82_ENTDS|nr:nhl repeat-containing protein, putative [Entamoeba dispar SAW760]EDR28230.1 nhl repeat-containing protein, putative [Entamoeba dispar SAW760]|eukprot:EDR28230.1 nhl repeat-containing protein, putative [Entamoeba dispar SAW760]